MQSISREGRMDERIRQIIDEANEKVSSLDYAAMLSIDASGNLAEEYRIKAKAFDEIVKIINQSQPSTTTR